MVSDKDTPLRQDVHLLGTLLGQVLQEQGGLTLFERVEAARMIARRRRQGDPAASEHLTLLLSNVPPEEAMEVVRAFSAYFGLVNLAERMHRIRRRRDYMRPGHAPQPGSWVAVLKTLQDQGVQACEIETLLKRIQIIPVLTAHPTEATRRSLLVKEQRMARALLRRITGTLLPYEEASALAQIQQEVSTAWQTDALGSQPTVADEVEHVVFYLTDVIYRMVPVFYEGLAAAFQEVYGVACSFLESGEPARLVHFGSWVGGDMDGNPNVGASTLWATLTRHRALILKRYVAELRELFDHLTQSRQRVGVDEAVVQQIGAYRHLLPEETIAPPYQDTPYRVLVWLMLKRLEYAQQDKRQGYSHAQEFLADLRLIAASLLHHRGRHAGYVKVMHLVRRVETFGFHLACLDIRQDAWVHRRCVGTLLGRSDFGEASAAERTAWLQQALRAPMEKLSKLQADSELETTLDVMQTLSSCQKQFGIEALGPYIISMAQDTDDILAVLYLARRVGWMDGSHQVPMDIAPLFETVPDLRRAGRVLESMLADPGYRSHVAARNNQQIVMLGYSDSSKESGLVASRWALQTAQEALAHAAAAAQVRLILFHGRGGTVSRGGSKPRSAVMAEPLGVAHGCLRLTEQGEIIHAKYGLRDIALRTLELMGGAVLEVMAQPAIPTVSKLWREAMDFFASQARIFFRALVYEDPDFYAYFQQATPIDAIQRLPMGSRPASRRAQRGIEDLRAIPWVFAWTQNRQMLPGWYGVGYGLVKLIERFDLSFVQQMAQQWPFFSNLLADTEMVLAKADMAIGAHYAALAGKLGERLWPQIRTEFDRTCQQIGHIDTTSILLSHDPTLRRSISLRNPYVDPMSLLQVDLLRRWRQSQRQDTQLEQALLTTVQGIARGLQNTG